MKKINYSEPADYFPKDVRKLIDKKIAEKNKKTATKKTVKRTTKKK